MEDEKTVRRSYTVHTGNKKKKKKKKNDREHSTEHMTPLELVLYYIKLIFDVPYMSHHRNLHIILCMFTCLINAILHTLILVHDRILKSAPYFTMKLRLKYNFEVILSKELWFGAHRYIVGGDDCSSEASYDFASESCAAPPMSLACLGFHIDDNEADFLSSVCDACTAGLKDSYRYFLAHACLHFLTIYLLSKRLDVRQDSPLLKQFTMLVSLASLLACLESVKLNASCLDAAKSTTTTAFDDPEISVKSRYSVDATVFSLLYSFVLFSVIMSTGSIPLKERKEARDHVKGMSQLKKSGAELFSAVGNTDIREMARKRKQESLAFARDLKKRSAKVYIDSKVASSRASSRRDGPYTHTDIEAFSL